MCLTPNKILVNSGIMTLPVIKLLLEKEGKYVTPYYNSTIPKNGVLRPKYYYPEPLLKNKGINGGVIHSYFGTPRFTYLNYETFHSYALIPLAAEFNSYETTLVSRALYLPDMDHTNLKEARLKLLRGPKKNITIQSFTRLFAFDVDLADYDEWDDYCDDED